jgi:RNA polymerase-binding protein DksA
MEMKTMAGENKKKIEKTTGKATGKTAGKTVSKAAGRASNKAVGKTVSKVTDKTAKKPATKTAGKASGKAAKTPTSKTAGKTTSKAASKTTVKAAAKKLAKAPVNTAKTVKPQRVIPAPIISVPIISAVDWQVFTEKMEQSLLAQKAEIMENLIVSNNDFKEIVEGMDPKDFADIASDEKKKKMIEALGSQELKRLKLIDSALTRIKQGKYGHCIKCDKQIPPDRLEALPYALMCVQCKSEEERRNR